MYLKKGVKFQSHQAGDLVNLSHMALDLESRVQEKGCILVFPSKGKPLRPDVWQGSPCREDSRDHYVRLGR